MSRTNQLKRIYKATFYSLNGIRYAFKNEAAFRQEVIIFIVACSILPFFELTKLELLFLIFTGGFVLIMELVNSAIEAVVDRIGTDHHELSGAAKDIGSATVLVSIIFAGIVWFSILFV